MPITQICIDMDGVLCDFVGPTLELFGTTQEELVKSGKWKPGSYEMEEALGITTKEFWEKVDRAGFDHWADLPPHDWHRDLLQACQEVAPTIILTSPSRKPASGKAKICWLQRYFGSEFRDFLIGPKKHFCARPGAVLVDDYDLNCQRFVHDELTGLPTGAGAIVFPRHWNTRHQLAHNPMDYVLDCLRQYQSVEFANLGWASPRA